jgi:hypothetical protein
VSERVEASHDPALGLRAGVRGPRNRSQTEERSMSRFDSLRPVVVVLVAVCLLALPARAPAEERAHHSRGTAQFLPGSTDFVGAGYATHLGRYTEIGSASFSGTHVEAWAIYTGTLGDQLFASINGELDPATGVITATVTYVGGTGRFTDATGSADLVGQLLPGGRITVTVKGTIDY